MHFIPTTVVDCTARALGVCVVLQSAELLQLRATYAANGVWRFSHLRDDFPRVAVLRVVLDATLGDRGFPVLLALRLLAGFGLAGFGLSPLVAYVWLSTALISLRWRGHFNGGSDSLTLVLASALTVACYPSSSDLPSRIALMYIAAQATLSYFAAGVAKLKEPRWRSGQALFEFVHLPRYSVPVVAQGVIARRVYARALSLAVIGFECLFPLAWVSRPACAAFLCAGAVFHLVNAWAFGLNRFWPIWLSTYPAIYYLVGG